MDALILFSVFVFIFTSGFTVSNTGLRLLVIHNNDMHARFEQTNAYGAPCSLSSVKWNRCYGGFARMKTAIREAIEQAKRNNIPSIVLNAGDSFQGTPYYDIKKWHIVQPLLESLHIDVMVRGYN